MGPGIGLLYTMIVKGASPSVLSTFGLRPEDFVGDERVVYNAVTAYFEAYGKVPNLRTVQEESGIKIVEFPDEPIEYWADQLQKRNTTKQIIRGAETALELAYKEELKEAIGCLRELLFDLEMRSPTDRIHELAVLARRVVEEHDQRQLHQGLGGVPFGMEYLDYVSDGAQPGDTIAIVGRPSTGKTYLMLRLALSAWEAKLIPLFLSLEMGPIQLVRRLLALFSKLSATKIRIGKLPDHARKDMTISVNELLELSKETPFYLIQGSLTSTVEDLVLQIQERRPAALYVDGAYMLRSRAKTQQRWERVTETAEILKRIAAEFEIPVFSSYQFNRRGPGSLGNIAFSDAIGQLASIVLSLSDDVDKTPEGDNYSGVQYKIINLIKGREGERGSIRLLYNMLRTQITQDAVLKGFGQEKPEEEEKDAGDDKGVSDRKKRRR